MTKQVGESMTATVKGSIGPTVDFKFSDPSLFAVTEVLQPMQVHLDSGPAAIIQFKGTAPSKGQTLTVTTGSLTATVDLPEVIGITVDIA